MKNAVKYSALHIAILALGLGMVLFVGALAEGTLPLGLCGGALALLAAAAWAAQVEIARLERLARQKRRMARRAAAAPAAAAATGVPAAASPLRVA